MSDWTLVSLFVIGFPINMFSLCLLLQKIFNFYVFPNGCFHAVPNVSSFVQWVTCLGKSNDSANSASRTCYM